MGQETRAVARFGDVVSEGRVQLETDDLRFRGAFRLTIPLHDVQAVDAVEGMLLVTFPEGTASFELGALAPGWAERIRNPKTLIDKLGVTAGQRVAVLGVRDRAFVAQLRARTGFVLEHDLARELDLIVLQAESRAGLDPEHLTWIAGHLRRAGALWIVHPNGQPQLSELDVLTAARAIGLTDTKVARFSATHTTRRFVWPRAGR